MDCFDDEFSDFSDDSDLDEDSEDQNSCQDGWNWLIRLVLKDDDENKLEVTGEPEDSPLPHNIKQEKPNNLNEEKHQKQSHYEQLKKLEGGQNVGQKEVPPTPPKSVACVFPFPKTF